MDDAIKKVSKLLPVEVADFLPEEVMLDSMYLLKKANAAIHIGDSNQCTEALQCIQAVLDMTWERLNVGHWKEVPLYQHQLYTIASLMKIVLLLLQSRDRGSDIEVVREALGVTDVGLIVGAPLMLDGGMGDLHQVAKILTTTLADLIGLEKGIATSRKIIKSKEITECSLELCGAKGRSVPTIECPSVEAFRVNYFSSRLPVKLTGCISHWPAMKLWADLQYLVQRAGSRTVPVEIGAHYVDPAWCQDFMTLTEFIEKYVTGEADGVGYLAQHPLFDQVPELRADIYEPEYCCLSDGVDGDDGDQQETDINAWFGPKGTVSPLHFDPKHNLLSQVVGEKRVLLYPPQESALLYPHERYPITNTARVDPELPDYSTFPEFQNACSWECHLKSGEMLYIPPAWWHHVRALTTSFSVSFWWK